MKDMIGRELAVGDYVAYYSNIYRVEGLGKRANSAGHGYVKIMIAPASRTSRPLNKYSGDMIQIPTEDAVAYLSQRAS